MIEGITDAPRRTVGFKKLGLTIEVPAPYSEGRPLRANEAEVLNQTLTENIRNNLSKAIKEAHEAGKSPEEIQALVDAYVAEYDFGVRRTSAGPVDPVEKEALKLAREAVRKAFKAKGYNPADHKDQIEEMAKQALEEYPDFRERARTIVEAKSGTALDALINV